VHIEVIDDDVDKTAQFLGFVVRDRGELVWVGTGVADDANVVGPIRSRSIKVSVGGHLLELGRKAAFSLSNG